MSYNSLKLRNYVTKLNGNMQNQIYRQMKSEALRKLKNRISNDLIVDYVIDHLIETNVFTEEEKTAILRRGLDSGAVVDLKDREAILCEQCDYFIDLLVKKMETNDCAYINFISILMKDGYYPWLGFEIVNEVMQMIKRVRNGGKPDPLSVHKSS